MLFLGNKKYPGESDFDSFCASSAGYSNAWTSMDRTVYHYVLAHDRLRESLDRFSGRWPALTRMLHVLLDFVLSQSFPISTEQVSSAALSFLRI